MTRTDTLNTLPTNDPAPAPRSQPGFGHVLACVDSSPEARFVLEQAAAMAGIMGAKLSVIRVMQPAPGAPMPSDPLDWDLSRRDVKAELDRMVEAVAEVDQVGTD
ncbi:MAG: universal stress protein, partial [Paracoccaceae bacterium]